MLLWLSTTVTLTAFENINSWIHSLDPINLKSNQQLKMALPSGRCRGARRVCLLFFLILVCRFMLTASVSVFYDRATLLQLRERSQIGLFDPSVLFSYPELLGYNGGMPGRASTGGSPGNNRPRRRRGRWEESREGYGVWLAKANPPGYTVSKCSVPGK